MAYRSLQVLLAVMSGAFGLAGFYFGNATVEHAQNHWLIVLYRPQAYIFDIRSQSQCGRRQYAMADREFQRRFCTRALQIVGILLPIFALMISPRFHYSKAFFASATLVPMNLKLIPRLPTANIIQEETRRTLPKTPRVHYTASLCRTSIYRRQAISLSTAAVK